MTAPGAVDRRAFIVAQTRIAAPLLVPEIRLHLASEATALWEATETALAREGLPPPYWAFAWPGGQALARYILGHRTTVAGRRVLDFAAGSGIAAIAAARAGASTVTASDIDAFALAAVELNAALNGVAVLATSDDFADDDTAFERFDVVLAGDVCYERPMAERVARWLSTAARNGCEVLIADPGRAYLPNDGLAEVARYTVPTSLELEDKRERVTRVLRVVG